MTIMHGTITANDLEYGHINCVVSITHKVVVANPDGPTHQQVHDYELDMLDYADKVAAQQKLPVNSFMADEPKRPADLPPAVIELPAETTGPLQCYTQTEDTFYLTVGGTQIVVERYDYITIKATPFDMIQPDVANFLNDAEEAAKDERNQATTKLHVPSYGSEFAGKVPVAEERYTPVQRSSRERNKPAGTITWAEHVEAWEGYNKAYRGTGQDAERIAQRGGFGYDELVTFLGHEPKTWKANV